MWFDTWEGDTLRQFWRLMVSNFLKCMVKEPSKTTSFGYCPIRLIVSTKKIIQTVPSCIAQEVLFKILFSGNRQELVITKTRLENAQGSRADDNGGPSRNNVHEDAAVVDHAGANITQRNSFFSL